MHKQQGTVLTGDDPASQRKKDQDAMLQIDRAY